MDKGTEMLRILIAGLLAVQEPVATDAAMWRHLNYYYLNPQPTAVIGYLEAINAAYLQTDGKSLADVSERGGLRTFYAEVLESSPEAVRVLEQRLPTWSPDIRVFANAALLRCDSAECERVRGFPFEPASEPLSVAALDDYWAAFNATGDKVHVEQVIAALPLIEVRGNVDQLLIGGAARWSLWSNAHQHTAVLEICKEALAEAEQPLSKILAEVIAEAEAEREKNPVDEPAKGER